MEDVYRCSLCGRILAKSKMASFAAKKHEGHCKRCLKNNSYLNYRFNKNYRKNKQIYFKEYQNKKNGVTQKKMLRYFNVSVDMQELNTAVKLAKEVYYPGVTKSGLIRVLITKFIYDTRKTQQLELKLK